MLTKGTNEIILDAYNANPSSMKVAIDNFLQLDKPNKCIIIGDMFELGDESLIEHQAIIDFLRNQNEVRCYFVGADFYSQLTVKPHFHFFKTFDNFSEFIVNNQPKNSIVLIKGSRGMALERTLELL